MIKTKRAYSLIALSLVFLFNPNINLIDVLPDCAAYAILILLIGNLSQTIPYLAECKNALIKLGIITLIKIPAYVLMYSNMKYGADIVPLFTLSFAALELILLYSAIKNLFSALSYVGERTDCSSVRDNFHVSKRKALTPEALEKITIVFFAIKAILNVLPELLMLTREDFSLRKQLSDAYPAVLVISIFASLIIGVTWLRYSLKYLKTIKNKGDFSDAVKLIDSYVHPEISPHEKTLKRLTSSLNILAVSSLFLFDISFKNFGGYNILPHFIYGIILYCSLLSLNDNKKSRLILSLFTVGFSLTSIINHTITARFFSLYNYTDLNYSNDAASDYTVIEATAIAETIFIIAVSVVSAIILVNFIKDHTDVKPSDTSYGEANKRAHRRLMKTTLPLMIVPSVINVLKCINVFLKEKISVIHSDANPEGITASGIPAFNTIIFLLCILYVIYSFVTVSTLKDEIKFKYGKNL